MSERVLVAYGGKFGSTAEIAQAIGTTLRVVGLSANGIEHDVKQYPGAGHAFLNDHHDPLSRAMTIASIGFHEPSATDARRRIVSFFDAHLKPQEASETGATA